VTKPTSIVKDPAGKLGRRARKAGKRAATGGGSALDAGKGAVKTGRKHGRKALAKKTGRRKRLGFI
jgi:hypothetical protein